MKHLLLALLLLVAVSAHGQNWLPSTCSVGDVADSYTGNWYMCASKDHWSKLATSLSGIYIGGNGRLVPMDPDCHLFFRDKDGVGHCPGETATGRWAVCEPCANNSPACSKWYRGCLNMIELQKKYLTAEPTLGPDNQPRIDHTTEVQCPDDYAMHHIADYESYGPICVRPREQAVALHETNHLYIHRSNCEKYEDVRCTLDQQYWVPIGKPVFEEAKP